MQLIKSYCSCESKDFHKGAPNLRLSLFWGGGVQLLESGICFSITLHRSATVLSLTELTRMEASHRALPHHPMPFVFFVLICDTWEICFILCKQRDKSKLVQQHKMKHIIHALHHQNTQTKGMG